MLPDLRAAGRTENGLSILYVGTLPPHNGGTAISSSLLLIGLAARGHRVRAIAPITAETLEAGERFALTAPRLSVRRYEVPYFETSPDIPAPNAYLRLEAAGVGQLFAELADEQRPDVVLAGRESFARVVPALAASRGLPCVLRVTGATSSALLEGAIEAERAAALLAGLRSVDALFTPARHLAQRLEALELGRIHVIPNAVDLDRFRPRARDEKLAGSLGIASDDVVVAHVSNLKPLKRPLDVVASAERALREEPRLFYLVVGDGLGREEMETACSAAGLRGRFAFSGWLDYERVPDYLSLADVVVLPSAFEAQARVSLETQACGRVLLASDIAGTREVVVDGETGVLFRSGDADDIAAKTVYLARRPDVRARIGERAREAVRAHSLHFAVGAVDVLLRDTVRARPS